MMTMSVYVTGDDRQCSLSVFMCTLHANISGQCEAVVRSSGWRYSSDHHWSVCECFRCQIGLLRDLEMYHRQTKVSICNYHSISFHSFHFI